jgi:hypothetical protein
LGLQDRGYSQMEAKILAHLQKVMEREMGMEMEMVKEMD